MQYRSAEDLTFDPREQISAVFVEGFYHWLCFFCKDKTRLTRALAHMFDISRFYVAVENETVAAIIACTDGNTPPIRLRGRELRRHLGFVRGQVAFVMLKRYLQNHPYPFPVPPSSGSVEFVATAPDFRNKGIAATLLTYVMTENHYEAYILEVADTNAPAVRLYRRLGFAEFHRVREPHPKQSGLNFYVYMRRINEQ